MRIGIYAFWKYWFQPRWKYVLYSLQTNKIKYCNSTQLPFNSCVINDVLSYKMGPSKLMASVAHRLHLHHSCRSWLIKLWSSNWHGFCKKLQGNFSTIITNNYIMVVHYPADCCPMLIVILYGRYWLLATDPIIGRKIIGAPLVLRHFLKVVLLLLKQQYISSLQVRGVCLSSSGHGCISGHHMAHGPVCSVIIFQFLKEISVCEFQNLKSKCWDYWQDMHF